MISFSLENFSNLYLYLSRKSLPKKMSHNDLEESDLPELQEEKVNNYCDL